MITMSIDLMGLDDVTRRLFMVTEEMDRKIPAAINRTTQIGADMVAGLAPVLSGELRGSIGSTPAVQTGDGWEGRLGTGSPYGRRRLDLGFSGTDSLGRDYNDPAHPAFGVVAGQLPGILAGQLRG